MKKVMVNLILWLLFTLMQCGPIVGTLEYGDSGGPLELLWMMLPFSLLSLALVVVTTRYAVPCLLLNRKWGKYAALEFVLVYVISLIEQLATMYIWIRWEIIPAGHRANWAWLSVNTFCNSLMFFFTLLAVGGWYLFDSERQDLKSETRLAERIQSYMAAVRRMLRPDDISRRLGEIARKVETFPREAESEIDALANELRENLYNLPLAPADDSGNRVRDMEIDGFNQWLTSRSHHGGRIIVFQLALVCICFGAFFATPDQPEFRARFGGFLVLLAMFEIIAGIDIWIFYRSFRRKRRPGRFLLASGVLAVVMILPILIERVRLYLDDRTGEDTIFIIVTALATAASVLMIVFYVAGIASVLLYQDWVRRVRRLVMLQATTKRLEYANLRKQINPHFLFNILNNASILTAFDPADARVMLLELRRLIDYQFAETERPVVHLDETIAFLNAYLTLETTRRSLFRFKISSEGISRGVMVPSLLFIPFVENAVKYSGPVAEGETVRIRFEIRGSRLIFECENPVAEIAAPDAPPVASGKGGPEAGGLGIANTLRRLELLYENDFSYTACCREGLYHVVLGIPLSSHNLSDI